MISKNIFSRFFSFLAMATLLVACSQNDDNAMTTTKTNTQANRSSQLNLPHRKLIINNTTHHTFINYLYALNILGAANPAWLKQRIIINPYTNIQIDDKYSNTTTLGIDYNDNGMWIKSVNGVTSIISAQTADIVNRTIFIYGSPTEYDPYVEWNSFDGTSDDGTVKFGFKVDAQTGEIFVNEPYGTFETTAFVNDSGDIVITLVE